MRKNHVGRIWSSNWASSYVEKKLPKWGWWLFLKLIMRDAGWDSWSRFMSTPPKAWAEAVICVSNCTNWDHEKPDVGWDYPSFWSNWWFDFVQSILHLWNLRRFQICWSVCFPPKSRVDATVLKLPGLLGKRAADAPVVSAAITTWFWW
jgi:hypothetical protein